MAQQLPGESPLVVDLLTTLRNEHFSPAAWVRFLNRSWEKSRQTAHEHPTLKRSWQHVAILLGVLGCILWLGSFTFEGASTALRLMPGFAFGVTWQICDLYWHLGLIRQEQTGDLFVAVGFANVVTLLRGLVASFVFARIIGGVATPSGLAMSLFTTGIITDILDGQVARHTHMQSYLGQLIDSEADCCLYLVITITFIQNGILSAWLGMMLLARFLVPLLAALVSYFLFTHRLQFHSTVWGRLAGLSQCLYFFVLLAPTQLATITRVLNLPLLLTTLALLVIAPAAQIIGNMRRLRPTFLSATMLSGGIAARKDFPDEDSTTT